ncbi:hypothetical protein ThidrDRAFT_4644, partial [Thiorhodococcus drewsii AZ1]
MFFLANRLLLVRPDTGMNRPQGGQRQQREQSLEALGLGEMGLFEV